MTRPLGRHQLTVLSALARHNGGTWSAGCVWQFRSAAYTTRVLDSLVQRGYVMRTTGSGRYAITESGLNVLGWYTCDSCTRLTRTPVIERATARKWRVRCSWCHTPGGPSASAEPPSEGARPRSAPTRGVPA
ncbi:helix-turn-helix domain-containing protein [Streptomyces mutabilis]|uniref:Uncharacterized protein n=1 Tax=Streptomyces mutabilis TaxID=67332 RepID=A0A086MRB1_9ACTN|nr:hypothetical protein [Streptomyces mutabilis]KFG71429.1 hypothetical protein FM21_34690 [Streptomyces mutabilis]